MLSRWDCRWCCFAETAGDVVSPAGEVVSLRLQVMLSRWECRGDVFSTILQEMLSRWDCRGCCLACRKCCSAETAGDVVSPILQEMLSRWDCRRCCLAETAGDVVSLRPAQQGSPQDHYSWGGGKCEERIEIGPLFIINQIFISPEIYWGLILQ